MAPIDLYFNPISPPSRSVLALAQFLGLDINVKIIDLMSGQHKTPEFIELNPGHAVPVIDDNGFVLYESRAILTYLVNKYKSGSALYPQDPEQRANVDKALYFDASSLTPAFLAVLLPRLFRNEEPPKEAIDGIHEKLAILEKILGNQQFLAGSTLTLADISIGTVVYVLLHDKTVTVPESLHKWYERAAKAIPEMDKYNREGRDIVEKYLATKNP